MNIDLIQWLFMALLAAGGFYIALRKSGSERHSLNASALDDYAAAAEKKEIERVKLEEELDALKVRLELVERKKYRVVMEFTIGDPPELGKVTIEPIIDLVDRNSRLMTRTRKLLPK